MRRGGNLFGSSSSSGTQEKVPEASTSSKPFNMWYGTGEHSLYNIFSKKLEELVKSIDHYLDCAKLDRDKGESFYMKGYNVRIL